MFRAFVMWRQRSRAIRELSKLSDLELADLGMSRREINGVVRAGVNHIDRGVVSYPVLTWAEIKAARQGFVNAGLLSRA